MAMLGMLRLRSLMLLMMLALTLPACMPSVRSVTEDKHAKEVETALAHVDERAQSRKTGSLWGDGASLFSDTKAHRVGDLITVLVSENVHATRSLGMKKSKKSDRSTSLGLNLDYGNALANKAVSPKGDISVTNKRNFDGSGSTNNSDVLTASVTAVVTKVYPNGNMRIVGRRQFTINQQPQVLTFSGVVRPVDIAPNNTIASSKIAQATITYGSGGELATVAHEGWLGRTLDQIWPF